MMAFGIYRVFTVGEVGPNLVGEKFKLRIEMHFLRSFGRMKAKHLLQEHDIRVHRTHGLAQFAQNILARVEAKTFVHIVSEDSQAHSHQYKTKRGPTSPLFCKR